MNGRALLYLPAFGKKNQSFWYRRITVAKTEKHISEQKTGEEGIKKTTNIAKGKAGENDELVLKFKKNKNKTATAISGL